MEIRKEKRTFSEKVWKRRIGLSTFGDVMKSKPSSAAATKSLNSVAGLELNDEIIPMLEVPLLALDGGECTGVESTLDLLGTGAAGGDNGAPGAASVCATASADSLAFSRCLFMCNIKGPTCATNNFK
jgi:hypothetical protein